jgi:hypothetical protein
VICLGTPQLDQVDPGDKRLDEQTDNPASSSIPMTSVAIHGGS